MSIEHSVHLISSLQVESNTKTEDSHDENDHEKLDIIDNLENDTDQWSNFIKQFQEVESFHQKEDDRKSLKYSLPFHTWIRIVDSVENQSVENVERSVKPCVTSVQELHTHLSEHLSHDHDLQEGHQQVNN